MRRMVKAGSVMSKDDDDVLNVDEGKVDESKQMDFAKAEKRVRTTDGFIQSVMEVHELSGLNTATLEFARLGSMRHISSRIHNCTIQGLATGPSIQLSRGFDRSHVGRI
ncbi:hypothetical protein CRG98_018807 [Punica granatum]|uniref:Uncharacterized protein n=1 Tax=Punica granatum TaxID=22663 RepID=A0A2I0JWX9_PUNGR|nr:hypothetical protein CRG98_018807 [Punica granatum]